MPVRWCPNGFSHDGFGVYPLMAFVIRFFVMVLKILSKNDDELPRLDATKPKWDRLHYWPDPSPDVLMLMGLLLQVIQLLNECHIVQPFWS